MIWDLRLQVTEIHLNTAYATKENSLAHIIEKFTGFR